MIIPLNNHIQIEPEVKDDFITSSDTTYNEVGMVVALPNQISIDGKRYFNEDLSIRVGDRVFFDSWTAAKYPKKDGTFYWLVDFANIRAYESLLEKPVSSGVPAQIQYTEPTQSGLGRTM